MMPARVLLVDDNDDIRMLIGTRLTMTGRYRVVGDAGDGASAVRAAADLSPDVIVLDLSMPGLGGLDALPLLRVAAPAARVVVMSGHAERTLIDSVLAAGAAGYVEKSLRTDVVKAIDDVLASGRTPERP
jgi:DNA-binding NarL/FixJ family response regulator